MSQYQHFTDYLRVLYKRRWVAAGAFTLVFAYSATTSLRKTPIYEATSQLLIEKDAKRAGSLSTVLQESEGWYDDDFYQTQVRMLQSRALAWRALQSMGMADAPSAKEREALAEAAAKRNQGGILRSLADLLGAPRAIEPPSADETGWQSARIDRFIGGLIVTPVRNSRLVNIRYQSPDPALAARAADALAQAYIAQGLSFRALASKDANQFLADQLKEQRTKLDDSERALQAYKEKHGAVALTDPQNNIIARKLGDISAEVTRARNERLEKEQLHKTLIELRKDPAKLDTFPAIRANAAIQRLRTDVAELKNRDAQLAVTFGENYSERRTIAASLTTKSEQLQQEVGKVVESIRNEYEIALGREQALEKQLQDQKAESLSQDNVAIGYLALEREAVSNRQLYNDLMSRAKVTGVTGEYKGTNVQVIDAAEMPRTPVLPDHPRDLTFGLMTAFLLAVGLAFGMEYLDSRIKTPDDIKAYLGVPFLGLVPVVPPKEQQGISPLLARGVPPAFSEAMRAVRTAVLFSTAADGARSVMVTSTAPSEGKTVVSTNLGEALAQAEQRTLIVDGDMRRPRVHDVFEVAQEPGLSNVLVGAVDVTAAIRSTSNPFLWILPAGHIPPNPAELLGSARYRKLLADLGKDFDWIIVDAPPVMAVTDAAVVSNGVGGVVFVVGAEMTPRRTAQNALEQLASARAKVIGAVLNRVDVHRHSYYYAQYYRKDYTRAYIRTP
ncbi:MAG TPA: polysaccharide biosynthesis tyrosine autokinase [Vicinamibacterales bacterium]|nr:polysaccharide biosynthesis tyrosine autokinase [Vicinamibacterales bacterium]